MTPLALSVTLGGKVVRVRSPSSMQTGERNLTGTASPPHSVTGAAEATAALDPDVIFGVVPSLA